MSIILNSLKKRNDEYRETTKKILELVKDKLSKAFQYYIKDNRPIEWFYLEPVQDAPNFVYIQGYLRANVGEKLVFSDGSITEVTEENYNNVHVNKLQLLLPINILEEGGVTEIYSRIRDYEQLSNLLSSPEIISAITKLNATDLREILEDETLAEKMTRPKEFLGFDVSSLSKDQMESLHINSTLLEENKSKVN